MMRYTLFLACCGVGFAQEVDFLKQVKPILESTCTHCHGADKQQGDLALHTLEACLKGGEGGTSLVPGDPSKSSLYTWTVHPADHEDIMPVKKDGPPLEKNQTDVLSQWIKAGAKWPDGVTLAVVPRMQFQKHIQPILESNCMGCHNSEKAKGDLDMSTKALTEKGGEEGASLVSFDPAKSTIYTYMNHPEDHDDLMPPKKSGGPMAKADIEMIRLWIEQGAPWPEAIMLKQRAKTEERPPTPDSLQLVEKIREKILAKQKEKAEADMKNYTGKVEKISKEFSMVAIKGGEFMMGSPETEAGRAADEGPQVKVKVDPFWMGAHEVTWDLYMPFMITPEARYKDGAKKQMAPTDTEVDAVSSPTTPYVDMTFGLGQDGYPAISMTEHAAHKFCQWLSAQTGEYYRLPTEAEWEYAARAGTSSAYFFGDDASQLGDYAWFKDNSDPEGKGINGTAPIGQKKPNPWGLYDILGNVIEWTIDQHSIDWYGKLAAGALPSMNPVNKPVTVYPRVTRGGGFASSAETCRSARRRPSVEAWKALDPQLPKSIWYHTTAQFLGFRVVRPLIVPSAEEMFFYWNCGVETPTK